MLFNVLIKELGKCTTSILSQTDINADFANMKMLSSPCINYHADTLYFAKASEIEDYNSLPPINIIMFDDLQTRSDEFNHLRSNLAGGIIFTDEIEYNSCYITFEKCFYEAYQMDNQLRKTSTFVYESRDIQALANQIADLFEHPMNIVNNSFSVVVSSNNYEYFSEDLINDIQSGQVPTPILKQLNIANKRRSSSSKTIVIEHLGGQFHNYFTPILFNGITLGYFSIFLRPNETMSVLKYSYLPRIAELLGTFMQRDDYTQSNQGNYYTALLSALLSENPNFHNIEEERFQLYGHKMKKYKYVICADISQESPDNYFLNDLSSSISKIFKNNIYVIQQNQIIFLASFDSPQDSLDTYVYNLENLLLSTPFIRIGISSIFVELKEVRMHYLQAQAAIDAGEYIPGGKHILLYDEYRMVHMVSVLGSSSDIKLFLLHELENLKDYDKEHDAELLHTLYIYTQDVTNMKKACEALHIHRNTLYFRLNKIKELTNLNLGDAKTLGMIAISFTIMQLQNEKGLPINIY